MNNAVKATFIFAAGLGVGILATRQYFKTKYETISQEEIDSVKEVWKKRSGRYPWGSDKDPDDISKDTSNTITKDKPALSEYMKQVETYTKPEAEETKTIHVISDAEFGELDNYETVSLIYYKDEVLADDDDVVLDNPDRYVGTEYEDYFNDSEFSEDAIYIRNDELKIDYEILRSEKEFIEMKESGPTED